MQRRFGNPMYWALYVFGLEFQALTVQVLQVAR